MDTEDGNPSSMTDHAEDVGKLHGHIEYLDTIQNKIKDLITQTTTAVNETAELHYKGKIVIGEHAIKFCLQCLQAGCTADEILAAWKEGKGL